MGEGNVGTVRRLIEAFNEGGMGSAATMEFFHQAVVFEEPPEQPGNSVAQGRENLQRLFGEFDQAWEVHRSEVEELRAIDDERVLLLSVECFRGRDGIETSQPSGTIFTVRDGKIVRMQSFWERTSALALVEPESQ